MSKATLKLTQLQGNFALLTCNFHQDCSYEDLRQLIATKFPQRDFEAIYTTDREPVSAENFSELKISEEIQLVLEFLDETDMIEEIEDGLEMANSVFTVTPCLKKILTTLKIQLDKEDFDSVDEFIEYLPECVVKKKLLKYKESPSHTPKFPCLAKRAEVNEEELNKEISSMLGGIKIDASKACSNCTKNIESTHYQCLMCPKYNLCVDCEAANQVQQFHDAVHLFVKLNQGASVNMNEILKTRRMLNRNCQMKKLCAKPEKKMRGNKNNKSKEEREQERLKKKAEREEKKESKKAERDGKKQSKQNNPNKKVKAVKKKEVRKKQPAEIEDKIAMLQSTVEALQKTVQTMRQDPNPK